VERENSGIPTDSSVWFGDNWLAAGHSRHQPSYNGTTKVKNGLAIQTRLFED
jgi:hypothetical protein